MTQKQKFFEIIRPDHDFDFVGKSKLLLAVSMFLVLGSIAMLPINKYVMKDRAHWMKFSLDFGSGREANIRFSKEVSASDIRALLNKEGYEEVDVTAVTNKALNRVYLIKFGSASVLHTKQKEVLKNAIRQAVKDPNADVSFDEWGEQIQVRYTTAIPEGGSLESKSFVSQNTLLADTVLKTSALKVQDVVFVSAKVSNKGAEVSSTVMLPDLEGRLRAAFTRSFGADSIEKDGMTIKSVGAKAGSDLRQNGMIALLAAIGFIMLYILARFDFRYAPGTVVALLHDAILVVGAFALFYREFSLTTIAAILTVIGYSMNDTIVVFDRIRENAAKMKDKSFEQIVNLSINETLSRTILTSLTVFFVTLAMNLLGTGVIRDFGFAMNIGVVVGTYSSIFVASPILILLNKYFYRQQKKGTLSVV